MMENWISIIIPCVVNIAIIASWAGKINQQLKHLEKKQDKHNNLIERMVVVEQSTKAAHHRLDDLDERREGK